jgi:uncharacterized protein (DUF1778 family)
MARTKAAAKRWNLRVATTADEIVRQAASVSCRNLTDFVQSAALIEAERVLADRTRFVLNKEQWERFTELLDRPERDTPALEELFSRRSVFG